MVYTVRGYMRGCAGKTVKTLTTRVIPRRFCDDVALYQISVSLPT